MSHLRSSRRPGLVGTRRGAVAGSLSLGLVALGAVPALASVTPVGATDAPPQRVILNATADPSTSQTVTWRSVGTTADVPARAEIRLGTGEVRSVPATVRAERDVDGARAVTFSATFQELEPATTYAYRVLTGESASPWHELTTASADRDPFTFTWYADGQNDLTREWTPIVELASRAFPNSVLTLQTGDLINDSVESEWEEWFTITDGERQTESWLPAIGNHEYAKDPAAAYWDSAFTVPDNGPEVDPAAPGSVRPYEELVVEHLRNRVYHVDHQGVRFITLNSHLVGQGALEEAQGVDLPDLPRDEYRAIYTGVQARWLDRVLEEAGDRWTVVQFHHPTFSVSNGRNNPEVRAAFLPLFVEHGVDLVLSGHDHTYARGYLDADATSTPGVTSGPVFVVSNSGPKYYDLAPDETNVWLANGATQVVTHARTSFVSGIRVTPDRLEYEAIVVRKGEGATATQGLGETADAFTITRNDNGTTSVTEGIERRVATGLALDDGEPVEGDIAVEATVPEGDPTLEHGALALTVAGEPRVAMGEARHGGDRWSFTSVLPRIAVTDTRREAAGWSLTGVARDLVSAAHEVPAGHLGWRPRVLGGTAEAGAAVAGVLDGGSGLAEPRLLASADDHARYGTTDVVADLALDVPVDTAAGQYAGALDVTLFPTD